MPDKNHSVSTPNITYTIMIPGLFPSPQQIQGWMTDDMFDIEDLEVGEAYIGIDGKLSAGRVNNMVVKTITLSPNSKSCLLFDAWNAAEKTANDKYFAYVNIEYPSIGMSYIYNIGALMKFTPAASAKKILQPRKFTINWEELITIPI